MEAGLTANGRRFIKGGAIMIQREIYQVIANIVDANDTFNPLSSYPKTFDSKNYDNDINKTQVMNLFGVLCRTQRHG